MTLPDVQTGVAAVTAGELYARLLSGEPLFILDVRNEEDFLRSRVEGRAGAVETLNLPYYDFIEDEDSAAARVPAEREIIVVCAKEGSSRYVAELLAARGIAAGYLEGGFASWGAHYDIRDVASTQAGRIVQVSRPARGDLSFVVISEGRAAIVDPLRHIEVYERIVAEAGATLALILDTHVHADHISGGPALAAATGAPYHVHAYDAIHPLDMLPARIAYHPLGDGQRFRVGQLDLTTIWYPGHTLGQVNFLLEGPGRERFLFTGDGIFLRSFGRPDLGGQGEAWTPLLYESMFERLPRHMTDETVILPAHFSGLDEGAPRGLFAAPYGQVRRENDGLRRRSPEEFKRYVLSHLPVFPPEYVEIKRVNIGLAHPTEAQANELELGKNICALSE